jgi:streptomycin 6-kinase
MALKIPRALAANCLKTPGGVSWLDRLPANLRTLENRWALTLDPPFAHGSVSCAWVAPARRADGTSAVLKLGMAHLEGEHEIPGLRFWSGKEMVRLLEADEDLNAMLLERCEPGTSLAALPESEQDPIISRLLRGLWRMPAPPHPFRDLSVMLDYWTGETLLQRDQWPDAGLVREGLRLFTELARTPPARALLATDLHAGNVLRSAREPWLVIDPKPFIGDPAYDVTQHLLNCVRLRIEPCATIDRMADLLALDRHRVRAWILARAAAEPRQNWDDGSFAIARAVGTLD